MARLGSFNFIGTHYLLKIALIVISAIVICLFRQTPMVLQCLKPYLDTCSGIERYTITRMANEIQLTSDLLCQSRSCRVDIAAECLMDVRHMLTYPVTLVPNSKLMCRYD